MIYSTIARHRLANQQIVQPAFTKPSELVSWFGAMQAQDYMAAKWAMGLRLPGATDATIEQAIADKSVVRTWAMRGTLHVMAAADVRWILTLLRPRLHKIIGAYCRKADLNEAVLAQSQLVLTSALQGGKQLTRPELKASLEQEGILCHEQRLNFILIQAAIDGLICCGCRRGKQFTYTLLDEWIPATKIVDRNDALTELATRYFTSHGPATLADFAWWSGLTVNEAKVGLELLKPNLLSDVIEDQTYWMAPPANNLSTLSTSVCLLPSFDEYLVAYKDRRAVLGTLNFSQIVSAGNGLFNPVIVVDGQVIGTWKRTIKKDQVFVETALFSPVSDQQHNAICTEIERFSQFLIPIV
jgi:hypothetical protein